MKELWKEIVGYDGCYLISNYGNVKSTGKKGITPYGSTFNYKEIVLKPSVSNWGY
jgi:hypothetical protein